MLRVATLALLGALIATSTAQGQTNQSQGQPAQASGQTNQPLLLDDGTKAMAQQGTNTDSNTGLYLMGGAMAGMTWLIIEINQRERRAHPGVSP